jgi:hypothetical protein
MDPRRTRYPSSALVRQLSRLTATPAPAPKQGFAEALSQWLGWTDAISLSGALNTAPASTPAPVSAPLSALSAAEDVERIKAGLTKAIAEACAAPGTVARGSRRPPTLPADPAPDSPPDYAPYRQRYQAMQQAMEERIEPLRQRLRAQLGAASPAGARLAAVDAVMEQVLAPREQLLLHGIASQRLEKRFDSLRPHCDDDAVTGPWLDTFRQDMHAVLLAELDTRLQPVEGLLAALRSAPLSP